jgi:hypothetical protein
VIGIGLTFVLFPKRDDELRLRAQFRTEDEGMASGVGLTPSPYTSAYACSKVALIRLTDSLQAVTAEHGVMVFATGPGRVRTSMVDGMEHSEAAKRWIPHVLPTHPDYGSMPWAPPERIAELCVRLARGDGDALGGRFIHVLYDFDDMRARAGEISLEDLYQLRLRTLPPR